MPSRSRGLGDNNELCRLRVERFSAQRMWPRLFQGGSVQVVKVGPQALLYEERGFKLNCFHYYRQGHVAAVRAAHEAIGAKIVDLRVLSYNEAIDELVLRIEWS
jgi:hypothetical protein